MIEIILLIVIIGIFFGTKFGIYKLIEGGHIPEWLNYKPYICEMCLGFWVLNGIYLALALIFNYLFFLGNILTILDTIAQYVHIKNNTVSIKNEEDYGKLE